MIHTNIWHPDTCGCEVTYEWDDAVPVEARRHTITKHRACEHHNEQVVLPGMLVEHDSFAPAEQNRRKNIVHGHALALIPEIAESTDDGSIVTKKGVNVSWSWSGTGADRILTMTFIGASFPAGRRNSLQAKVDQVFGPNKVVIR